jgi:prepilin-type N-terminal cleavage/methylation domain-containing protein
MSVIGYISSARPQTTLRGFTLLEMAVVLVIVGFLLGGLLTSLSTLQARQREDKTLTQLDEIREALITFAAINRRLPCPATAATADTVVGAGREQAPIATGCTGGPVGVVPWVTLGLQQTDAWGRRFTYRVTPAFSRTAPAIGLLSSGDNTVQNRALVTAAAGIPAVVVSHGQNAFGSRNRLGVLAPLGGNVFEQENADADAVFVADTPTTAYEDLLTWVPTSILIGRMLQAGTLP